MNYVNFRLFYIMSGCLIALFILLFVIFPTVQINVFFRGGADFGADFFNVCRYISDRDPYNNLINGLGEKCYFPLAYLLLYPFTLFEDYANMSLIECWHSPISITSFVVFSLLSFVVFVHSFWLLAKDFSERWELLFVLIFSSIFIFSIERGNFSILTIAMLNYFLAFYHSNSSWKVYFALLALCIAVTLKVYPVILGILLLKERRYKDIMFCVLLTLLLIFLPFLFFKHGMANFEQLLSNVALNSDSYSYTRIYPRFGIPFLVYLITRSLYFSDSLIDSVIGYVNVLNLFIGLLSIVLVFFNKREVWKSVALLIMAIIMLPTNSALYSGLYLFPVITLYFVSGRSVKSELIYILLFIAILSPCQLGVYKGVNLSSLLINFGAIIFWIILVWDVLSNSTFIKEK